jgi:hypothetical protein
VGKDCYVKILSILENQPNIRTDYVYRVPEKNNHCYLTYDDSEHKREILKGGVRRLVYADVIPLLNCDIILLNYISGGDIYLRSLQKLCSNISGKIYIDIHSLTLGKRNDGIRYFRKPPGWTSVVAAGDYIQMNCQELALLAGKNSLDKMSSKTILYMMKDIESRLRHKKVTIGSKIFIITAGTEGCYLFYYRGGKSVFEHITIDMPVHTLPNRSMDSTGCGDCFSAGFILGLTRRKDLHSCAELGNEAGKARIVDHETYKIVPRSILI